MKFAFLAAAALAAGMALPAASQTAPAAESAAVTAGATVYGPDGQPVGTIDSINGQNAVLNTGTLTATLPFSAFGTSDKGPTITLAKADLEAAITAANQKAAADLAAALVTGAEVYSVDGQLVGPIKSIDDAGLIVVEYSAGPVSLKKDQIALQAGKLTVLATAADIAASVAPQPGA